MLKKMLLLGFLMLAWAGIAQGAAPRTDRALYHEKYRPQFHFTARNNWLNDPNGLVYYKGTYHLFFQHNPLGINWGNMHWGHAVSPDLVHWRELPIALEPDGLGTIFSGSAVVDWKNTSGLRTGRENVLVALYTGAPDKNFGAGKKFTQCLATSNDGGRNWKKYAKNPVLDFIAPGNRDPRVFWHAPSSQWIMALYLDRFDFAIYGSKDLKQWTRLSGLTVQGSRECPELFEMPVLGPDGKKTGQSKWIFFAADGNYLVGSFDGTRFTSETQTLRQDWGSNFYASQTYSDIPAADGRRIQIAWMRGGKYPEMPFNQQMSFPCELRLVKTGEGPRLARTPVREIEGLHTLGLEWQDVALKPGKSPIGLVAGSLLDIRAEFDLGQAREVGLVVCGQKVWYSVADRKLTALGCAAPLAPQGGRIQVQVLADRSSLEVFGNGGLASLSSCFLPQVGDRGVKAYAKGGRARLVSLKIYVLNSIWGTMPHFEPAIEAFEMADAERRPAEGGIVFVGSSSFKNWGGQLAKDMKPLPAINRGFGGSQMSDAILYADRIVIPYRPKSVVVYEGSNDVASGKSPEQVLADTKAFVAKVHKALPETKIYFVALRPSLKRANIVGLERRTNTLLKEFVATDKRLAYIDVATVMYDERGKLRRDIFVPDRLHLNRKGYELFGPPIKNRLLEDMKLTAGK